MNAMINTHSSLSLLVGEDVGSFLIVVSDFVVLGMSQIAYGFVVASVDFKPFEKKLASYDGTALCDSITYTRRVILGMRTQVQNHTLDRFSTFFCEE